MSLDDIRPPSITSDDGYQISTQALQSHRECLDVAMNTAFLLMAQYGGKAVIPIEDVCRDYFSHLNATKLVRKITAGEIAIPLVRIEASQKCAKGVHLSDLAKYLDARVEAARKEMVALNT